MIEIARQLLATHGLGPELEQVLASVLDSCFLHLAEQGDVICKEGAPPRDVYFLLEGQVLVRMRDYLGVEKDLAVLHGPSMFGHMGMIDRSPRSASCIASTDVRLAILGRELYTNLVEDIGPAGDMFRRLLLSAMNRQLTTGNSALKRLFDRAKGGQAEPSTRDLDKVSGMLEGWHPRD